MGFNPANNSIGGGSDANISNPATGEVLQWDNTVGKWINATPHVTASGITDATPLGRTVLAAPSTTAARTAIGAIGTDGTVAQVVFAATLPAQVVEDMLVLIPAEE